MHLRDSQDSARTRSARSAPDSYRRESCSYLNAMRNVFGRVLLLYALLISFGDAFKLHTWVPLPLAVLLLGLVAAVWSSLLVRRIRLDSTYFRTFDVLLLAYLVDLGVSLLFSGRIEPKNINHLVAYSTVIALYYFFVK